MRSRKVLVCGLQHKHRLGTSPSGMLDLVRALAGQALIFRFGGDDLKYIWNFWTFSCKHYYYYQHMKNNQQINSASGIKICMADEMGDDLKYIWSFWKCSRKYYYQQIKKSACGIKTCTPDETRIVQKTSWRRLEEKLKKCLLSNKSRRVPYWSSSSSFSTFENVHEKRNCTSYKSGTYNFRKLLPKFVFELSRSEQNMVWVRRFWLLIEIHE